MNNNIIYKKISDINISNLEIELLECLKLWNEEVGLIYPISSKSFYQNVINYFEKDGLIAFINNKVIGFIILKWFNNKQFVDYTANLFISLFYVSKKYRKQGIGSKLFDFAENFDCNKKIIIGKDLYNFFPGVPTDFDNLTDFWLEKRGYNGVRYTHDLISYNPKTYPILNKDVKYMICPKNMKDKLITFIKENNWGRWALEVEMFYQNYSENEGYLIGLLNNEIVSFAKVNDHTMKFVGNNVMWQERFPVLGGIGPLGVSKKYRNKGLGIDLISQAINELLKKDITTIIIDWTGLMELYRKFNFEVWKSYKYMENNNLKNN